MQTAPTQWRDVPWWFWAIALFQVRGIVLVVLVFPLKDMGALALLGDDLFTEFLSVLFGIPALLMVGLYSLRARWARLLQWTLVMMIVASLADIAVTASALLASPYPEGTWYTRIFMILLNLLSVVSLVGSPCVRHVFWARQWRWH